MPMEEALMAFAEIDISRMKNFTSEKEKGIPFISFVMKEKEGAVFTGPHPLFIADSLLREQKAEGREILYRADYIRSGTDKFATGVLSAGEKQETFLKLLKNNISSGNAKADIMGNYREANCAYYKEVLSYVATCRRHLNRGASGILLPPFPERNVFMAGWYREHKGGR